MAWGAATSAHAADWWVDANAPGGGSGGVADPFNELQDGVDAAMPGDTVHVLPGTYDAIQTVRHGAQGSRIVVVSEEARQAIVMASGTALEVAHDYHTFEGLIFDSSYSPGDGIDGGGDALELTDVEVRRTSGDCIDLHDTDGATIEGCSIHHCVAPFDPNNNPDAHGVTGDSVFDLTIRNSEIYMLTGDAVQLSPARDPWDGLVVEQTVMWSGPLDEDANGWSAGDPIGENAFDSKVGPDLNGNGQNPSAAFTNVLAYGWRESITNQGAFNVKEDVDFVLDRATIHGSEIAFRLRHPAVVRIQNAVIWEVDKAFRLEDGIAGLRVFNATLGNAIGEAIEDAGGDPQNPTFSNVLFLAAAVPAPADTDASNMATDDSVFVDAANDDYHLQMGSAPTDAGIEIPQVTVDRDGVPRPFGNATDIGAFEWTDAPPPTDTETDGPTDGGTSATGSGGGGSGTGGSSGTDGSADTSTTATGGDGGTGGTSSATSGDGCGCRSSGDRGLVAWIWLPVVAARRPRQFTSARRREIR
jgi:hypothetical protein